MNKLAQNATKHYKYNRSVAVTITRVIRHQKDIVQSRRSMRSAREIFNTRHVFTKEPIRDQGLSWSV